MLDPQSSCKSGSVYKAALKALTEGNKGFLLRARTSLVGFISLDFTHCAPKMRRNLQVQIRVQAAFLNENDNTVVGSVLQIQENVVVSGSLIYRGRSPTSQITQLNLVDAL